MAGYGAVVSLQLTIERILESSRFRLVSSSRKMLRHAYKKLGSLREILERLDSISPIKSRKKVNALDGGIKEAVWRFEDVLEHQILSQLKFSGSGKNSINLQSLRDDVASFKETVRDMEMKFLYELDNMPQVKEDESTVSSSRSDFGGKKAKMVGFSQEFQSAKYRLMQQGDGNYVFSVLGMPGSGKTALAKNVFEDPAVLKGFDHRVWVRVGRKYQFNEIGRCILAQVIPNINTIEEGDEKIIDYIKERLKGKRCLVVLDDVWDTQQLDYFISCLPNNLKSNGCIRILLTTNLSNIPRHISTSIGYGCTLAMRPLNEEQSKDLLRETVFGGDDKDFPRHLEKAAKKIAKNCNGHPLMIVTVAALLSKSNKIDDQEYWNEVADNRKSAVMMDAHNQISKVLFPVYDCSPQSFKMLYLYMGAFPQDKDIPASKLINMLSAEGFIQRQTLDQILEEFCYMTNVVVTGKKSRRNNWAIKTCRLNPSWCYMLNKEASKHKFLFVLTSGFDDLEEGIKGQRRLCLHTNFVFNFKSVFNSVKHECASTARSVLCFGPYHPYSMPLDVGFKLVRVVDALKVRFYNFPIEILELVFLQYLALTYNGELPTSISKLLSLQFLIIHPHTSIKTCGAPSYVPVQIWDMEDLQHIEIPGSSLPNPKYVVSLQKLSTLVGVSANTCTMEVLVKLPNLRKLGIQIELTPDSGVRNQLNCFDHLKKLGKLDTLKCSVVNPEVKFGIAPPWPRVSIIPSGLRKLHLSGLGYLWEDIKVIGAMPYLDVLKLRCYAFRGPKWETESGSFLRLRFLVIEDADLVQWQPGRESFPKLFKISIKHCYKLRELQWPYAAGAGKIKLLNCNPLGVTCAKQLIPRDKYSNLTVVASFDDKELSTLLKLRG